MICTMGDPRNVYMAPMNMVEFKVGDWVEGGGGGGGQGEVSFMVMGALIIMIIIDNGFYFPVRCNPKKYSIYGFIDKDHL